MLVHEHVERHIIFDTLSLGIWVLPRSGGPFLKKSAAYPKRFGQSVCRNHRRFLDDPCFMLQGFSLSNSYTVCLTGMETCWTETGINPDPETILGANLKWCCYSCTILWTQHARLPRNSALPRMELQCWMKRLGPSVKSRSAGLSGSMSLQDPEWLKHNL